MVEHGLEVPNLLCPKSYKIRNSITNFQKLNFKNEVYLTLKNKSLYSLYSVGKLGVLGPVLESMILQSLGKPKFHNQICFKISKRVPHNVVFYYNADLGSQDHALSPCKGLVFVFHTFV